MTTPDWIGYHHITLNVQDVDKSADWYAHVLGFMSLASYQTDEFKRVILRHPSGVTIGLNRHRVDEAAEPFSERRAGLDHLALRAADREALEAWLTHLQEHGVAHSEIKPGAIPGSNLIVFRDPDNIQLELFAPPSS